MKKILFLVTMVLLMQACEKADEIITFAQLPQKAQQFVTQYFPSETVSYVKKDPSRVDRDYEVVFSDGKKIEFSKQGEWTEVDCLMSEVPEGIIMQPIKTYVDQKHAGQLIVEINRDKRDYEIRLLSGLELAFDLDGRFLRYDD